MSQLHCTWLRVKGVAVCVLATILISPVKKAVADLSKIPAAPLPATSVAAPVDPEVPAASENPGPVVSNERTDAEEADRAALPANHPVLATAPGDRIETSESVPPSVIEVRALDPQSMPVAGVHIELSRDRQSVSEGNTSTKWQATTDGSGQATFTRVPSGSDSQYRVVVVNDGARYGSRPFPLESRAGTKVVLHVYPVVRNLKEALVAGRGFFFIEPRDDVLSIEFMQQFHNLGQTVFLADGLTLHLPQGWKAFATNPTDLDLSVVKTTDGVSLLGAIAPGQHSVAFTFQVPSSNRERIQLELDLWSNTAELQVATLARPGLELQVEGFPNAGVSQSSGRQPMLVTGKSFTRSAGPPEAIHVEVAGLPVVGPGRWAASLGAAMLALGAVLAALRKRSAATGDDSRAAARACIVDELAALERAHRNGQVGKETFADTREILLSAFVRIERESVNI
jgi:hypothetical protein